MEFVNLAYISKVNIAALNGSEGTGGNIVAIKKVSTNDGREYAYVSGQAQRRYQKETLMQLGQNISGTGEDGKPDFGELNKEIYGKSEKKRDKFENKELLYENFCDLDLFGYMMPKGSRRWSPIKVAPMLSMYPYKGEYDYLTRKAKEKDDKRSGNIVQIEVDTLNYMRGNIMIDKEKIGCEVDEYSYELTPMLDENERKNRYNAYLDAIACLNGGAKQSRNLEDLSPRFIVAIRQNMGNPFLLNSFEMTDDNKLEVNGIIDALSQNKEWIDNIAIGINKPTFENDEEIIEKFKNAGYPVTNVGEAIKAMKDE